MPKVPTQALIDLYVQILIDAPHRILASVEGLNDAQLRTSPNPDEWSLVEIMAHVRGAAEIWTRSIFDMLKVNSPELTYVHPRTWIKNQGYAKLSFDENFQAYKADRDTLISVLQGLPFDQWNRSARFKGKVNTYTLFGEVVRMASHDDDHCRELEQRKS
jgi:hypothetical protein